jgi:hypothetical protein
VYRVDLDDDLILETPWADDALATLDQLTQAHGPARLQAFAFEGGAYQEHPSGDWIDCSGWSAIDRADLTDAIDAEERQYAEAKANGWVA